jgi:hypothetical protein
MLINGRHNALGNREQKIDFPDFTVLIGMSLERAYLAYMSSDL